MTIAGQQVAWGIRPEWAEAVIFDVPVTASVVKRRFRCKDAAQVFVKEGCKVTRHYVALADGGLKLLWPVGMNVGKKGTPCL